MKKKKTKTPQKPPGQGSFSHNPFKGLRLPESPDDEETAPAPVQAKPIDEEGKGDAPPLDDDSLLADAMAGVVPLTGVRERVAKKAAPRPLLVEADEEELVMRHLDELVHGEASFSFADTSEFIEASQAGLDRRLIRKLRKGEFSWQAHLDLHGHNRDQARAAVGAFIRKCVLESKKCVLIVHGRGLGSKDNIPVLKTKLAAWLTRGSIGKKVLAYTSALPWDGGTGAVYVLLRTP